MKFLVMFDCVYILALSTCLVSLWSWFSIKEILSNGNAVPIVIFHGFGDVWDTKLATYLQEKLGVHSEWVEPSPDSQNPRVYSIFTSINNQGKSAWDKINNNTAFSGEFDLIGFSQGNIVSRYIIQYCNLKGKVRNFISFGGPLNGQSSPICSFYDILCILRKWFDNSVVFNDDYQASFAPANYWKNPNDYNSYLNKSTFLAEANNERNFSTERKNKFLNLKKALFIKWENEQTIHPAESSWWGEFDSDYNVIHRNNSLVYKEDLIGIKSLETQGRAKFISIPGVHMEFTYDQIDNIVIPFLLDK